MESRRVQPVPQPESEGSKGDSGRGAPASPGQGSAASKGQRGSEGGAVPLKPGDIRRPPTGPSLREKLFDKEVLEKFAEKEEPKRDSTITFDTEEFKYHTYMVRLREKIESIWKYPPEDAMRGIYGDLYIRFTIKKNGLLGGMELVRTSGHRSLDEAAQQALRDAQPFWPLPDEWGKDALTITGHFVYSIYGTNIR
ncbi:MAG TPA: energy transducer TonB [Thermodesulfovibrionales bacterium]|jgi:protein TonB|nr:energy transducer TonB [Thermodesulfovibrionales bacterium]